MATTRENQIVGCSCAYSRRLQSKATSFLQIYKVFEFPKKYTEAGQGTPERRHHNCPNSQLKSRIMKSFDRDSLYVCVDSHGDLAHSPLPLMNDDLKAACLSAHVQRNKKQQTQQNDDAIPSETKLEFALQLLIGRLSQVAQRCVKRVDNLLDAMRIKVVDMYFPTRSNKHAIRWLLTQLRSCSATLDDMRFVFYTCYLEYGVSEVSGHFTSKYGHKFTFSVSDPGDYWGETVVTVTEINMETSFRFNTSSPMGSQRKRCSSTDCWAGARR